jgi:hypothetical protein
MIALQLLACHMLGDFILQTDAQAREKFSNWRARAVHVTTYSLPFVIVALLHGGTPLRMVAFMALLWSSHFVIDMRRWKKPDAPLWLQIAADQTLHIVVLAIIVSIL